MNSKNYKFSNVRKAYTLNKTRGRSSTLARPIFQKENFRRKLLKSNFPDSDDDCYIDMENQNEPVSQDSCYNERSSNKLESNSESSDFDNTCEEKSTFHNNDYCIQDSTIQNEEFAPNTSQPSGVYNSAEERYKLLEDLYSVPIVKQTLVIGDKYITGTCQDMCPEIDRYHCEAYDNISPFERDEKDKFDHNKAVKIYDRSAADKRPTLPWELRTTEALDRSLKFILKYVVDNVNKVSWRQWYTYLWNRTRSILKDITQQNLRNPTVVRIVEIITRLYIFCAERLCEESEDVFSKDQNENSLKNSLQMLKAIYKDMPKNSCRNEAEFRGYMLIVNIDKGDALDETSQLSSPTLRSEELKFAMKVYWAITTSNYVRFFRLIQNADLITSCLMHRFIVPMRLHAFKLINKAYVANKSSEHQVPLGYFCKILGFEDIEEAANFCYKIGLTLESNPINIVLNGSINIPEELSCFKKRSQKLVEVKLENRKLSTIFCSDEEFEIDITFPPCQMVSFSNKNRYIGNLKFPANRPNAVVDDIPKLRQVQSKDNFDLSDSDFTNVPELPKPRTSVTMSPQVPIFNFATAQSHISRQNTNLFATGPITGSNIFSSSFQNPTSTAKHTNIFSPKSSLEENLSKSNLFPTVSGIFSKPKFTDFSLTTSVDNNVMNVSSTRSPFLCSNSPNLMPESNKIVFYIPPNQELQSNNVPFSVSDEDIDAMVNETNDELLDELIGETCNDTLEMDKMKTSECESIERDIMIENIIETVIEALYTAKEEYKFCVSNQYLDTFISEILTEQCQNTKDEYHRKERSVQKGIQFLKRSYFSAWRNITIRNIADRKNLSKLPAAPLMIDDFSFCEGFRGKVRKIATRGDVHSSKHPIMTQLEQCVSSPYGGNYLPRKVVRKCALTQTNVSYADLRMVAFNEYVRQSVVDKFLSVLDKHRSVLEMAQQVDPTPEQMISDYNNLIDSINSLTENKANISISSLTKLPSLLITKKPISKWSSYVHRIFIKLDIPQRSRNMLMEDIYKVLKYLNNSQELPELSYYHLRFFPWIEIIKCAVLNKLSLVDKKFAHIDMEIDNTAMMGYKRRLDSENISEGLSLKVCLAECEKHRQSFVHRVLDPPPVKNSRRLSEFQKLMEKITELETKLNDCQ